MALPEVFEVGESLMGCFVSDKSDLFCANYVDDIMFPMCDKTYVGLLPKIVSLASIVFDCFASFLLKICFKPNEITFMFGLNDSRTKLKMGCSFDNDVWTVLVSCKAYGNIQCGVVGSYKYLGLVSQQK